MKNSPHDSESASAGKSVANDQFRAVVKRLLDTPPMHKTSKPSPVPSSRVIEHASDCAVHNGPAYEAGPCTCGAIITRR
jgi:hypothetical protein